jgi:hypothetical protein
MAKQPDTWQQHVLNEATSPAGTAGFTAAPANPQPFSVGAHLQPQHDPIDGLPTHAAERLRMLRQRTADAHRLIPGFEAIREASMARIEAEQALKRLTSHPQDGGFNLPETDARVIEAQRHLDKMTADFQRLKESQEIRIAAWHAASGALAGCEDLPRHGVPGNCRLEMADVEAPKLNKGEGPLDAVDRLRRRGRELRADLHRIESAPYPSSYAKAKMRAQVEALAMQGAPSMASLIEHDGKISWPQAQVQSTIYNATPAAVGFAEAPDALALFAWLHKDELIAALDHEIDAEADDAAALTHEQRQQQAAEVALDLLEIERSESELVWAAQSQGLPVEHRPDISPLALLGLKLVTAPRADALPETTPGYSWPMRR